MKKLSFLVASILISLSLYSQHTLGEWYGGGTVFYIYDNGQHGLIAAHEDQGTSVKWFIGATPMITGALRNGINSFANTEKIVASQGHGNHAAMVCLKYNGNGFGDWYLPSKDEVKLMFDNKNYIKNLSVWYWSSTESGWNWAWVTNMTTGIQNFTPKANAYHVRAIRAF